MTLYARDGLLIIMMERFEPLTTSVDCKGDDGEMSLTFASADAFNHALQQWSYINENEEGKFLMIANHAGCGPDDQRQPYLYVEKMHVIIRPRADKRGQYIQDHGGYCEAHNSSYCATCAFFGGSRDVRP